MSHKMKISPKRVIRGSLRVPGDKSISHRTAMIASLAEGISRLKNFSTSADCASTLSCMEQLGARITRTGDEVVIQGSPQLRQPTSQLDCGNSGTTIRLLSGILAGHEITCELVGDESLSSRPMARIIEPLQSMGARIESHNTRPPLTIQGTSELRPIQYKLPVASAQVKSAILFAGLRTRGRTTVIEDTPSRDHTERLFKGFGVDVDVTSDSSRTAISIDGPTQFAPGDITIPGDISSAAYFVAAAMLLPDSKLEIQNVGVNPTRAEFLNVLRSAGAHIETSDLTFERNEPAGTIAIRGGFSATNQRVKLAGATIPSLIDELPLLAVIGTQFNGGIEIANASELRHKETDRLKATAHNLRAMGAEVQEREDGLAIGGPTKLRGAEIESFGDHRIAMAFSVASLIADGPTEISGSDCVRISFPEFYELLDQVVED